MMILFSFQEQPQGFGSDTKGRTWNDFIAITSKFDKLVATGCDMFYNKVIGLSHKISNVA